MSRAQALWSPGMLGLGVQWKHSPQLSPGWWRLCSPDQSWLLPDRQEEPCSLVALVLFSGQRAPGPPPRLKSAGRL